MSFVFNSLAGVDATVRGHNAFVVKDGKTIPTGGYAHIVDTHSRPYLADIYWQDGPVDRGANQAPTGAFVEDVLEICKKRLEHYQDSSFACEANATAIEHIKAANQALIDRRQERKARGVEGKNVS